MQAGKPKVAVPTTVHCDHLIQAKDGAATDLKNANFNMTEFKKTHGTKYNNTVDAAIILELQQSIWMDRRAELAGIAASNSVIELKKLDGS